MLKRKDEEDEEDEKDEEEDGFTLSWSCHPIFGCNSEERCVVLIRRLKNDLTNGSKNNAFSSL